MYENSSQSQRIDHAHAVLINTRATEVSRTRKDFTQLHAQYIFTKLNEKSGQSWFLSMLPALTLASERSELVCTYTCMYLGIS